MKIEEEEGNTCKSKEEHVWADIELATANQKEGGWADEEIYEEVEFTAEVGNVEEFFRERSSIGKKVQGKP